MFTDTIIQPDEYSARLQMFVKLAVKEERKRTQLRSQTPLHRCLWKTEPHLLRRFWGYVIVSMLASPSCGASPPLCVLSQERRSGLQYIFLLSLNQLFGAPAWEKTALAKAASLIAKQHLLASRLEARRWRWQDGLREFGGIGYSGMALHCSSWEILLSHSGFKVYEISAAC